ncbi:MAG TPA: 2-phospho-L-lactate guanylyltransferase [Candidatus Nitrosotalea sp.]|nr:2-phospho-L-lactate guanylyltransferase [Candidatus Nitrosotalea sp.]
MSSLRIGAIVPVKTFSRAKTRLSLPPEKKERVCIIMLESVLDTIVKSGLIEKTVVVSKDEKALEIGERFGAFGICDKEELGVNNAVRIADNYLTKEGFDSSVVFPQDIPLIQSQDIQALLNFGSQKKSVLVVPSRKFDGTNALFRRPTDVMETHYDEDSYKIHLDTAEKHGAETALVLIRRIMLDVDEQSDLDLIRSYDLPISKSLADALL